MQDIKALVDWLLEPSAPSVRYRTLTELLYRPKDDPEVEEAQREVMESRIVRRILDQQKADGGWDEEGNWYYPKYTGSIWRLLLLSQLGVDPENERIRRACEYAFRFQLPSGAFTDRYGEGSEGSWGSAAGCLNGNVLTMLARLDYGGDTRIIRGLRSLIAIQEADGGWLCRSWKAHTKDKHSCFMGTIPALEAINAIIPFQDTAEIRRAGREACEFLLMHKLYLADHHNWRIIKTRWTHLGFPYFTDYDILRGLLAVLQFGIREDPRLGPATELLLSKRTPQDKWVLERTYSKMGVTIEKRYAPSKWVSFHAAKALKLLGLVRVA